MKNNTRNIHFIIEEFNNSGGIKILSEIMNTLSINDFKITLYVINNSQQYYFFNKNIRLEFISIKKNKFSICNIYKLLRLVRSLEGIIFVTNFRVSVLCSFFRNKFKSKLFFLIQGMDKVSLIQNTNSNLILKKTNNFIYFLSTKINANRIYVSKSLKSAYNREGLVISNYCSDIFYSNNSTNEITNQIKIGIVSTSSPNKGFNLFIEIANIIRNENLQDFHFLFECATQDQKLINDFSDNISFVKPLNELEMSEFYNSCNIILSLSYSEGFNLPVLEAMASGRIVISTNDGATNELIESGYNGLLVNTRDPFIFANLIISVIQNKTQSLQISKNAIKSSQNYSLNNFRSSYLKLF